MFHLFLLFFVLLTNQHYVGCVDTFSVNVDWENVLITSRSTVTLQVVANPLLNPKTCPVADKCWQSLANLGADLVRYVPWFPYPKVGVAELNPPDEKAKTTSWNFVDIIPQLTAFMNATVMKGHTTIPNFSTQPTWMYDTKSWSYPENPNQSDFGYPRGVARANTTAHVAAYYGRLLKWLVKGWFVDEFGHNITGGPAYGDKMTHWEVFNEPEGCHGLDAMGYVKQYDAVVTSILDAIAPHKLQFVGLALQNRNLQWWETFLNASNHKAGIPRDYASFHFYANCRSRTDPTSYEAFFTKAHAFLQQELPPLVEARAKISPETKISCDEMGVILPADNDPKSPIPPPIYWNAASAMWAYLVGNMINMGVEILGESQLAGSPPIPSYGIPDPQFPSVSMLNWTTGEGNARYWTLKLLLDHGPKIGDNMVSTDAENSTNTNQHFCSVVNGHYGYTSAELSCVDSDATISEIQFSAFGTPTGSCGNYKVNPKCNAKGVKDYVAARCIGQKRCSVLSYPTFGDPCHGTYKELVVQAKCSTGGGKGFPSAGPPAFYAQGWIAGAKKSVLLVNTKLDDVEVTLPTTGGTGGKIWIVDEATGWGPAREGNFQSNTPLRMSPFSVGVAVFDP